MTFTTNQSLLGRITNDCQISWTEFYKTYSALIKLHGRDYRLTPDELEDLTQEVMKDFFKESQTFIYDKSKGRFRDYLRTMIRFRALNIIKHRKEHEKEENDYSLENEDQFIKLWEEEHQDFVIKKCCEILRRRLESKTYQAFELCYIQNHPIETVSKLLDIKPNAIYAMRHRILKAIKETLKNDDFRIDPCL